MSAIRKRVEAMEARTPPGSSVEFATTELLRIADDMEKSAERFRKLGLEVGHKYVDKSSPEIARLRSIAARGEKAAQVELDARTRGFAEAERRMPEWNREWAEELQMPFLDRLKLLAQKELKSRREADEWALKNGTRAGPLDLHATVTADRRRFLEDLAMARREWKPWFSGTFPNGIQPGELEEARTWLERNE